MDDDLIWALVDAAPDALVTIDDGGTIELVNSRTEELFGYNRSDLLGQPVELLVPESARTVHRAHRTRYRADAVPRAMGEAGAALRGRRADGSEFPVEISLSPVTAGGRLTIVAAVRDVSDRLRAERHSRAIRHAVDTAVDGVFITDDRTMEFTYVNQCGADMHGYTVEEMIGMTPLHVAPDLDQQKLAGMLEPLLAGETDAITIRTNGLRKDGSEFPAEIHVNHPPPPSDLPDATRPLIALVRDISDRVRAEQDLADSQAMTRLAEERDRLARDLHDRVIGDLFGVGLKLQSTVALINDERAASRVQESVSSIDDVIGLIRATIFGLTSHAADSGVRQHLEQQVASLHERLGHEPDLTMTGSLEDMSEILVDELSVVIHEAITNIAKHANATATSITINAEPDQLSVTITDNGTGLHPHESHLATGLGLNNLITRAEHLGGQCTLEGLGSRGAILTWTVPVS